MQIEQLPSGYKLTYCTTSLKEIYDLFSETGKEELTELLNSHLGLLIGHSTQLESMSQRFSGIIQLPEIPVTPDDSSFVLSNWRRLSLFFRCISYLC